MLCYGNNPLVRPPVSNSARKKQCVSLFYSLFWVTVFAKAFVQEGRSRWHSELNDAIFVMQL